MKRRKGLRAQFESLGNFEKLYLGIFAILILIQLAFIIQISTQLEATPSCLYGCADLLAQGGVKDVINNPGNFWQSNGLNYKDSISIFPKGTYYVQGAIYKVFAPVFGWDYFQSWKSAIAYSIFFFILISMLLFWGIYKIFDNIYVAGIFTIFVNAIRFYPAFGYRSIIGPIIITLFLHLIIQTESVDIRNKKQFFGYGALFIFLIFIVFNMHPTTPFILGGWVGGYLLTKYWRMLKEKKFRAIVRSTEFIFLVSVFAIATILTLISPWWYHAVLTSGGDMAHEMKINDTYDLQDSKVFWSYLKESIKSVWFNFSSLANALRTILIWGGVLALYIFNKLKRRKLHQLVSVAGLIGFFLATYNFIITVPILGVDYAPSKLLGNSMLGLYLVALGGIYLLFSLIKERKVVVFSLALVLLVLISIHTTSAAQDRYTNNFFQAGFDTSKNINYQMYENLYYEYFEKNNINPSQTIILSTNEIATTLNALLGTQLINGRFAHYYHFEDYQPYWLDSAILIYSNDTQKRKEIIEKYQINGYELYFYWDFYWQNSEFQFTPDGQLQYYYNPLKFINSSYREILDSHNIKYFEDKQSFEPNTYGRDKYRKFILTILSPENYHNQTHPWNPSFDPYLEEAWSFQTQGQTIARLYKVRIE